MRGRNVLFPLVLGIDKKAQKVRFLRLKKYSKQSYFEMPNKGWSGWVGLMNEGHIEILLAYVSRRDSARNFNHHKKVKINKNWFAKVF